MQKTSGRWALGAACGGHFTCNSQLDAALSVKHAGCGPGLCEAADDFARLIARVDPQQLTATDLEGLRDLLLQLRLLNLGS